MLQQLKARLLRRYIRFTAIRGWRGHFPDNPWSELPLATPIGSIPSRLYSHPDAANMPLVIYLHGGGWTLGDLDAYHGLCQRLCAEGACSVIAVDYRLAPEHPFPAAQDDCLAATRWIVQHLAEMGPNNGQVVLAGDSAGGNLAAITALALEQSPQLAGMVLTYPATDHYSAGFASYRERASDQRLTANLMHWFWDTYLAGLGPDDERAATAFPQRAADLSSLPPTMLVTAEYDPLRDEGRAFGKRLEEAGVAVSSHHYPEAEHGFAASFAPGADFEDYLGELVRWLGELPR